MNGWVCAERSTWIQNCKPRRGAVEGLAIRVEGRLRGSEIYIGLLKGFQDGLVRDPKRGTFKQLQGSLCSLGEGASNSK